MAKRRLSALVHPFLGLGEVGPDYSGGGGGIAGGTHDPLQRETHPAASSSSGSHRRLNRPVEQLGGDAPGLGLFSEGADSPTAVVVEDVYPHRSRLGKVVLKKKERELHPSCACHLVPVSSSRARRGREGRRRRWRGGVELLPIFWHPTLHLSLLLLLVYLAGTNA